MAFKQFFRLDYMGIRVDINQIDDNHFKCSIESNLSLKGQRVASKGYANIDSFIIDSECFDYMISLVKVYQFDELRKKVTFCVGWDDLILKYAIKGFFLSYQTEGEYFQFEEDDMTPPLIDYTDEIYPEVAGFLRDILWLYVGLKNNKKMEL